jgi:archaellum component FlaC
VKIALFCNEIKLVAEIVDKIKQELDKAIKQIMSAISIYVDKVNAFHQEIGADIDSINANIQGVSDDVAGLKKIIEQLQNNPGPITPEDQALLDTAETQVGALATKLAASSLALKALDEATPPTPPPTV